MPSPTCTHSAIFWFWQLICACLLSRFSRVWLFATLWSVTYQAPLSIGFSRENTESGCHALLQGIFPTQNGTHVFYVSCIGKQVLYHQCHLGNPWWLIGDNFDFVWMALWGSRHHRARNINFTCGPRLVMNFPTMQIEPASVCVNLHQSMVTSSHIQSIENTVPVCHYSLIDHPKILWLLTVVCNDTHRHRLAGFGWVSLGSPGLLCLRLQGPLWSFHMSLILLGPAGYDRQAQERQAKTQGLFHPCIT